VCAGTAIVCRDLSRLGGLEKQIFGSIQQAAPKSLIYELVKSPLEQHH